MSLTDSNGVRRAELAIASQGPDLILSDSKGKPTASLCARPDNAYLFLNDPNGPSVAQLGFDQHEPELDFFAGRDGIVKGQVGASFMGLSLATYIGGNIDKGSGLFFTPGPHPIIEFTGPKNGVLLRMDRPEPSFHVVGPHGESLGPIH